MRDTATLVLDQDFIHRGSKMLHAVRLSSQLFQLTRKKSDEFLRVFLPEATTSELEICYECRGKKARELFPDLPKEEYQNVMKAYRENLLMYAAYALIGTRYAGVILPDDQTRTIALSIVPNLTDKEFQRLKELFNALI